MKILFLGDYSSLHATLARELKRHGHTVTLVSDGGKHMLTDHDILLQRRPGKLGGIRYMTDVMRILPELKGYDVVQLVNPHFLALKPGRIAYFFRQLKMQNGAMALTLAGNEHHFLKACLDGRTFRYSQFRTGDRRTPYSLQFPQEEQGWMSAQLRRYAEFIYANIDGAMSTLYEYHVAAEEPLGNRLAYIGLPVDTEEIRFSPMEFPDGKVDLFIGMVKGREVEKGTDILADVAHQLECEMPDKVSVTIARNMPLKDYLHAMSRSHIVLDQLYSYSPALNALDAMCMGRVAATGAQPEVFDFIGEEELRPLISLSPLDADLKGTLREYVMDRDRLVKMGEEGRRFAEKHNDVRLVTDRYINHCERIMR